MFSAIALVAVANGALLTMIMSSRLVFGMAEQGLLPRSLSRVLPRRRTPWVAIVVTTLVAMALTITGDLATLANTVVLLLLLVFLSTNTAVLVLRRDRVAEKHFRVPAGGPGPRHRVLSAAALAAGGRHLAVRRHPPGDRRRAAPARAGVRAGAVPRTAAEEETTPEPVG